MLAERGRLLLTVVGELLAAEVCAAGTRIRGPDERARRERQRALRIRTALERLGPLYVKAGQVLSTREDLVPPAVARELESLHDRAAPCPFDRMSAVLEAELGPDWRRRFRHFDTERPLGCASIAQAYAAVLDDGRSVVVKVQRPGIAAQMTTDMRLLRGMTRTLARRTPVLSETIDFEAMLAVIFEAVRNELDLTLEAANMDEARAAVTAVPGIDVPGVVHATERVLIQRRAPGTSVRDADPAAFDDAERERVGTGLLTVMYQGYFIDHRFHADPHPGNVFVCPGGPTTLIDWGMIGRLDRHLSSTLLMTLLGLANNDAHAVARAWSEMGRPTPWADIGAFEQDMSVVVPRLASIPLDRLRFGASLATLLRLSTRRGIRTNPMIGLLGKSFANMEGTVRHLAPHLSATDVLVRQTGRVLGEYAAQSLSQQQLGFTALQLLSGLETLLPHARAVGRSLSGGDLTLQHTAVTRPFSLVDHRSSARIRRAEHHLLGAAALVWLLRRRGRG
ncbi:ABC1 kinase family protein [Streptantibioticus cattleyicolor]|uniref:ATP/GTP-binding protein n=1 Tax=Streptantibioticus cattleyicolor (strain ATCC 35852 / DSM 46488 / JCM 4925 / NBRC 14057 / NRRL 8057) TaxID=1003195 RepID=F8JLQ4_STREN|nr:AarF/UbiB family protein [Streptantibioticus cattleyicolor]AEW99517.1 ATP/GTP-binding protein [Streptantibioticus cattleyicolor NRRL 8057 = DSM 46488]CCB71444.1 putative ATP/GTP-binding protein [Streptantibioticus cattleyicolor NRRL 8057 = DSM 46488]